MRNKLFYAVTAIALACFAAPGYAGHDPSEVPGEEEGPANVEDNQESGFELGTTLTGIGQYGAFTNAFDEDGETIDDTGRGAAKLDLEIGYTPTPDDQLFALVRFAAGNGLRDVWPGPLLPDAHDLEDDLKDINGSGRNYILQAWYKHSFHFGDKQSLGVTGGILDANVYIGQNEYADGEDVDFMNDAFVNPSTLGRPVYAPGAVAEFATGAWNWTGLYMNTRTEDAREEKFNYYVLQMAYALSTQAGEGHYRLFAFSTDSHFLDPEETSLHPRQGIAVSLDQPMSKYLGMFAILVHQEDDAAVDFQNQYSGGLHIYGDLWGRPDDAAGIAYAYLDGGNLDADNSQVVEGYIRFQLNSYFDLTADLQYLNDELRDAPTRSAWVPGVRFNMHADII